MKWLFGCLLCLGYCQLHADNIPAATAPQTLRLPSAFFVEGRISIRYVEEGRVGSEQQLSGQFSWQQHAESTHILISSPTGQAIAEIRADAAQASWTQAGQSPRIAPNVNQLSQEVLGWPLPVAGLRDWLQGVVQDENGARILASNVSDSIYAADGWRIRYASWHDARRPKRIDLERHIDAQGADVYIRIILDPAT